MSGSEADKIKSDNLDGGKSANQPIAQSSPVNSSDLDQSTESDDDMAPTIGKLSPFDQSSDKWDDYIERFEFYLEANKITEDSGKRCTLLTAIGAKTYETIKNLVSPSLLSNLKYTEIKEKCNGYFNKKINELLARVRFHKRDQLPGESLKNFEEAIRALAQDCKFGGEQEKMPLNIVLRDRFVAGIQNQELQRYLCRRHEEALSTTNTVGLTLDKALEIGLSIEATANLQKEIKENPQSSEVNRLETKQKENNQGKKYKSSKPCFRCEKSNHIPDKCYFKNATCNFCKKVGHIENACLKKKNAMSGRNKNTKNHAINADYSSDAESSDPDARVYIVKEKKNINRIKSKYRVKVTLNSVEIEMEMDNGADESLINASTFKKIWPEQEPVWEEHKPNLRAWGKRSIETKGITKVNVEYKNMLRQLPIIVTEEDNGPNLFGDNWFKHFGIEITGIHATINDSKYANLLKKFPGVQKRELSGHEGPLINIELKEGSHPKFCKARRIPYGLIEPVNEALNEMIEQKMITPVDQSDWATPVLFVKKSDGQLRVVGDYKVTVNPWIRESEYPMPTVSEALNTLNGGTIFSQIDLKNAYKQLRVAPETSKILTISTPLGLFNVNVLLDGLNIAPRLFQKFIMSRIQGIPGTIAYLDNIKVQGQNEEEHDIRLSEVLKRLQDANLRINKNKCIFGVSNMEFLGYKISKKGVKPLKSKIEAISKMRPPTNIKELQIFLGGINFYARFIKNRAKIAEPLHRLLDNKTTWKWEEKEERAFQALKESLISAPILSHFDDGKPIIISADASPVGVGAVLANIGSDGFEHPIAFMSKTLAKAQRNYSQLEREALSLIEAVKHFHYYVAGRKFQLLTDHKPLLGIFNPKKPTPEILSPKMSRYCNILSAYDFELVYRSGKKHNNADFLSRLPLKIEIDEQEDEFREILMIENVDRNPITYQEIAKETENDEMLPQVKKWILDGWPKKVETKYTPFWTKRTEMSVYKGCILWGYRVVVPKKCQKVLLNYLHGNHTGICNTKAQARSYVWWPKIDLQIENMVKNCPNCIENQIAPHKTATETWIPPKFPWERLHIDFAGPFHGQQFLIVVDAYTKWLEVFRMQETNSAAIIKALRKLFATFGIPSIIVNDNAANLTSREILMFYEKNGIKMLPIAPYNPQANGQAERMVQTTKTALKKFKKGDWDQKIARFLLKQHTNPSSTTGKSPAELMFNRKLKTALDKISPVYEDPESVEPRYSGIRKISPGCRVRMRNFRSNEPKWTVATCIKQQGNRIYIVKETKTGLIHKRDIDQLVQLPEGGGEGQPESTETNEAEPVISLPFFETEVPETTRSTVEQDQPARRTRPKRKCVTGSKNRYRDSILESSVREGLP